MKIKLLGIFLIFVGIALAAWLGGYVMLYGGINAAIAHVSAGAILRALFAGVGCAPGYFFIGMGITLLAAGRED